MLALAENAFVGDEREREAEVGRIVEEATDYRSGFGEQRDLLET